MVGLKSLLVVNVSNSEMKMVFVLYTSRMTIQQKQQWKSAFTTSYSVLDLTGVDKSPLRAADPHFINVACSRAKHLLVVVGNFTRALASNDDWAYVQKMAKTNGSYIDHDLKYCNGPDQYDIGRDELERKLMELLKRPKKKRGRSSVE
jgi:hypothetical protein